MDGIKFLKELANYCSSNNLDTSFVKSDKKTLKDRLKDCSCDLRQEVKHAKN